MGRQFYALQIGLPTVSLRASRLRLSSSQEVLREKSTSARSCEATVDNLLRRLVGAKGFEPLTYSV